MSWQLAHRVAHIAASQAHAALGVDPAVFPVQMAPAIDRAGLELMWQPMPNLFGAYLDVPGGVAGILVNNRMTRATRRQTAAHELGHHRLGHGEHLGDCTVDPQAGPASIRRGRGWSADEKAAEAFAAWFLMPRKAVLQALACQRLVRPTGPADSYRLSLLLGTSYRATVRHLPSLKLASAADAAAWGRIAPATLKRRLVAGAVTSTQDLDVWEVDHLADATTLYASPSDLLVIRDPVCLVDVTGPALELGVAERDSVDGNIDGRITILSCRDIATGGSSAVTLSDSGGIRRRRLHVVVEPRPHGRYPLPPAGGEPNSEDDQHRD